MQAMTKHAKLIPIGDAYGIVIPDDVLSRLRIQPGDSVALDELSDVIELRAAGSEFDRQMAVARELMRKDWNVLHELAK